MMDRESAALRSELIMNLDEKCLNLLLRLESRQAFSFLSLQYDSSTSSYFSEALDRTHKPDLVRSASPLSRLGGLGYPRNRINEDSKESSSRRFVLDLTSHEVESLFFCSSAYRDIELKVSDCRSFVPPTSDAGSDSLRARSSHSRK